MRKLGIYPVSDPNLSLCERIRITSQIGFDYIAAGSVTQLLTPGKEGFLTTAEKEGLEIDNVHLSGDGTSKVWLSGEFGDQVIDRYKREMQLSLSAGVGKGVVHVTWGYEDVPVSDIGIDRFSKLVEFAEKIGFVIGFENSVSSSHFRRVMDEFQASSSAMFTFDTGHWNAFCPQERIYEDYSHKIAVTHLADNDGMRDLHLIPLDGCADYKKISSAIAKLDRLTFELSGPNKTVKTISSIEEEQKNLSNTEAYTKGLVNFYEQKFTVYEKLSYEAYLCRVLENAKKLCFLLDEAT